MIVCSLCGQAVFEVGDSCVKCSGKGVERDSPFKSLLTPTQRRGSPDRWAKSYTTPPRQSTGSPLVRETIQVGNETIASISRDQGHVSRHLDIQQAPGSELARVYGSLVDKVETHPSCTACRTKLVSGRKIYLPRSPAINTGEAFCRPCYSSRFNLGTCRACQHPIVGDEEEPHHGGHVRGRGDSIWHAGCFKCELCDLALYKQDHLLAVSGDPRCPSCFPPKESTAGTRPLAPLRRFAPPGSVLPQKKVISVSCDPPSSFSDVVATGSSSVDPKSVPRNNYRSSVQYLAQRFKQSQDKAAPSPAQTPTKGSHEVLSRFMTREGPAKS